jgi:beta-glucosidase
MPHAALRLALQGTAPLWPFGHGLSYTTFVYSNLTISGGPVSAAANASVSFALTNTGSATGAEVAQLYLGFPPAAGEPPQLLRDFAKVRCTVVGKAARPGPRSWPG